jgi:hypothetical protein
MEGAGLSLLVNDVHGLLNCWRKERVAEADGSSCGLQKKAPVKGKVAKKNKTNKFIIDCTIAETDNILDGSVFVSCPSSCEAFNLAELSRGLIFVDIKKNYSTIIRNGCRVKLLMLGLKLKCFAVGWGEQEKYLKERIKVDGKAGNLGDKVQVSRDKSKIVVTAETAFSKRYLKYLAKKYLKKNQVLLDSSFLKAQL